MNEHKSKFTPGPWSISVNLRDDAHGCFWEGKCVISVHGDLVADVEPDAYEEPNASLIAAAPEMYALLERLSHALFAENADEWAEEINAMLAKANGEAVEK